MMFRLNTSIATGVAVLIAGVASAAGAEDFYAGKTVRLIVGSSAGGGYDTNARLVAPYMEKYLPGKPSVVVVNMPGASGTKAVNHLYAVAPKDGSTFATFNSAMPFLEAVGSSGVRFKSTELSWIGSLSQTVQTVVVWHTAGVRTLEDAKKKEVVMGGLGKSGTMVLFPRMLNSEFGTKFRVVTGYKGGRSVNMAMERGEVQGRGAGTWYTWKNTHREWVKEGKIIPLVQIGPKKDPDLPNVPLLNDLAQTPEQLQMFKLLAGNTQIERPFAGPPGIPADRLNMLRRAFDKTVKDPAFIAQAEKIGTELDPQTGEEVAEIVKSIIDTPPAAIAKVKEAVGIN